MSTVFDAIGDPTRRRILDHLRDGESSVTGIVERLELPQPSVSKHLRVLRDAGLVAVRADARRRVYRLEPRPLRSLDTWLEPYRRMWDERLDALEQHLDTMEEP